jgi:MerR family transcriptional regulator, multidrug-efflux activator
MGYTVSEVAQLAGVSVRTLHYYDEIGLLKPASVSPSGYRLYSDADLERLQQILFFKEIGFELSVVKEILDHPDFDRKQALEAHRQLLVEKMERLQRIVNTVDKTLEALKGGETMAAEQMFKGFDMRDIEAHMNQYADEARERYGKERVDAVIQRTSQYSADRWAGIMQKWDEIFRKVAAAMDKGPKDPEVQRAVHEIRQLITDNFYDCTLEIFRGLGNLYVDDERFTANIDKYGKGLAEFLRQAIHVYCDEMAKAEG